MLHFNVDISLSHVNIMQLNAQYGIISQHVMNLTLNKSDIEWVRYQVSLIVSRARAGNTFVLYAKLWKPGGEKSIFMVVMH